MIFRTSSGKIFPTLKITLFHGHNRFLIVCVVRIRYETLFRNESSNEKNQRYAKCQKSWSWRCLNILFNKILFNENHNGNIDVVGGCLTRVLVMTHNLWPILHIKIVTHMMGNIFKVWTLSPTLLLPSTLIIENFV